MEKGEIFCGDTSSILYLQHGGPQWVSSMFDAFLRNRTPVFVFLRFGPLCNASRSFSFTNAYCDIEGIKSRSVPGRIAVDMEDLFARGFQVLQSAYAGERNRLSEEEKAALADLENFLLNIGTAEKKY